MGGPYGVLGGGEGNQLFDDHSVLGGGYFNTSHGSYNVLVGGDESTIDSSSTYGFLGGGSMNSIQGAGAATIAGGNGNLVTAVGGTIAGGAYAKASHSGQFAHANGAFAAVGDAQSSLYVLHGTTSNGTQTEIFLDGATARMTLSSGSTWVFSIFIVGRSSANLSFGYRIDGVMDNNAGTTSILGTLDTKLLGNDHAWSVVAQADDTHDALVVKVTGEASTNIRWVASVRTTEVIY